MRKRNRVSANVLRNASGLAGCGSGLSDAEVGGIELHQQSLLDRCGQFMRAAFPGGNIKVTKTAMVPQATESIATIVASAEGLRRDLPKETVLARDVAVECRFDDNILTGFRWTKGPLSPTGK
jgi:hypothetical protein